MKYVFGLITTSLDRWRAEQNETGESHLKLQNRGLLTVFIDKCLKILHIAMLHPQDYSVDLISKFLFTKNVNTEAEGGFAPRNWLYLLQMFQVIETYNQSAMTDIKLALIRFIAEFLVQVNHFEDNFLDELIDARIGIRGDQSGTFYQGDFTTYGSVLFIEFAKVFKELYIDASHSEQVHDAEN